MARVELTLNGHPYAIACEDGQEPRLREIAAFADAKLKALAASKPNGIAETQLLVLSVLTLADQIFDLRAELAKARTGAPQPSLEPQVEERVASAIEALAKRITAVSKKIAAA